MKSPASLPDALPGSPPHTAAAPEASLRPVAERRGSRLPGFHRLSVEERREALTREGWLTLAGARALARHAGIEEPVADTMSENVIGVHGLPLAVGLNFRINGRDFVAPMSVEEPSVVAAASHAARVARETGGFLAEADEPLMLAQIQLLGVPDPAAAAHALESSRERLLAQANAVISEMVRRGGGAREIELRVLEETPSGAMVAVHFVVDTRDAMGANLLNTLAEAMAAPVQAVVGGRVGLRILSNLADRRRVRVRMRVSPRHLACEGFPGEAVRDGIVEASRFAELDPYRACTHNKGIMNGVDAVVVATGNDWRAVEAGAHAYAAREGRYRPLSTWRAAESGELVGALELPLALGIVGGAARAHPGVRLALQLAGVESAQELATLAASVGLASNFAALRALATEGIQKGHMALHARSVAAEVGATTDEIEPVALQMAREGDYRPERARSLVQRLRLGLPIDTP